MLLSDTNREAEQEGVVRATRRRRKGVHPFLKFHQMTLNDSDNVPTNATCNSVVDLPFKHLLVELN